jgi:hypothetical protein
MNRGMLVLLGAVCCGALAIGCGDDGETGGSAPGGGGSGAGTVGGGGSGAGTEGGGGATGVTCASYCTTIMGACTAGNSQYGSQASCEASCAAFEPGAPGDMAGDTLECRAYHAGVAAMTEPEIHCVHAGPLGTGPAAMNGCGMDACTAFCNIAETICSEASTYDFTSFDDCRTKCQGLDYSADFNMNQMAGEVLECHMYHLSVAAQAGNEEAHCGHLFNNPGDAETPCMGM